MIQQACGFASADQKGRVKDLVARWEQGMTSTSEAKSRPSSQHTQPTLHKHWVLLLQSKRTPRHVKHGMSAVAQNNYHRLRQIQQAEDTVKETARTTEEAAIAQGESLSGLFPKLRSSVTRTGN